MQKRAWTVLTNHGRVLAYLARHPETTIRKIAQEVNVTERAIQKVLFDLEVDGYIVRHKVGRCNRYTINPEMPMRHRLERDLAVGDLLQTLGWDPQKPSQHHKGDDERS